MVTIYIHLMIFFSQTHNFNLLYKTTLFTPLTLQYSIYRHYLNPCNTNRLQFSILLILLAMLMMHTCACTSSRVYTNLFLNGQFYFDSFWMRLCPHKPSINQANLQGEVSLDLKFTNHFKLAGNMQRPLSKQSHHLAIWAIGSSETGFRRALLYFQNGYLHISASQLGGGRGSPVMN